MAGRLDVPRMGQDIALSRCRFGQGASLAVVVVNPGQVTAYANALGKRARTDTTDAAVTLPSLGRASGKCPLRGTETEALAGLVARRRQIVRMIAAERAMPAPPWQRRHQRASSQKEKDRLEKVLFRGYFRSLRLN
ncbi:hypothetical protein [Mesorhizobium sp. M0060]|uniref:hypothetical protein n=1 Tax=Mesorhizobium sp. M0060 TaxID=2956866 RepID=UPI0033392ABF